MDETSTRTPNRELSVDLYRVVAAVVVVLGHWLAASVTYGGGGFANHNVLAELPETQWLTLVFQVVPVFFLVAGYASAASWDPSGRRLDWLRRRLTRTLGPTTVYVVVALLAVALLIWAGVDGSQLAFGTWAVALHLWFIPVYLVLLMLTPVALAAQRRWGLVVPVALTMAVAAVDAVALSGWLPWLGSVNYVLCWAAIYQLGIAWYSGAFRGRRPLLLAAGSALLLTILLWPGPYPMSMVGVPGQAIQNTSPPTVAMVAFAALQAGLLISAAPAISRRLRASRWRRPLAVANQNVMMLYLWHMVPVVVVSLIGYPTGLLPQPPLGSAAWWLSRLAWVAILAAVTAAELAVLWLARSLVAAALPTTPIPVTPRCAGSLLLIGAGTASFALSRFGADGFAAAGHFPVVLALLYAIGVGVVSLNPVGRPVRNAVAPTYSGTHFGGAIGLTRR